MAIADDWKFNSIVCFDLETTGLPAYDRNVKITELAVIGVVRSHIDLTAAGQVAALNLPRVSHKLSFSVYPNKMISLGASNVTGLYNDMLEPIKPWSEKVAEMLVAFLNHLPSPVCLIAHNGLKFDFKILQEHLKMFQLSLPEHVVCADSLPAFRTILPEFLASATIDQMAAEMNSGNDELIRAAEGYEQQDHTLTISKNIPLCILNQNEITPDSKCTPSSSNALNQSTGKSIQDSQVSKSLGTRVRRNLFPSKPRISFKLSEVYRQLFGDYPNESHNAEDDAATLLKCILKTAPEFLKWANENCQPFGSVE